MELNPSVFFAYEPLHMPLTSQQQLPLEQGRRILSRGLKRTFFTRNQWIMGFILWIIMCYAIYTLRTPKTLINDLFWPRFTNIWKMMIHDWYDESKGPFIKTILLPSDITVILMMEQLELMFYHDQFSLHNSIRDANRKLCVSMISLRLG